MKLIEEGKIFNDQLSIEELDQVTGGEFCFIVKWCEVPGSKDTKQTSCGILICKPHCYAF